MRVIQNVDILILGEVMRQRMLHKPNEINYLWIFPDCFVTGASWKLSPEVWSNADVYDTLVRVFGRRRLPWDTAPYPNLSQVSAAVRQLAVWR